MTATEVPKRVGLIGLGVAGLSHWVALWDHVDIEVVALCRRDRSVLERNCAEYGIAAGYVDARTLLEREHLDGVIVATSHRVLAEHACLALAHVPVVLVEKPLATDVDEARRVLAAGRRSGARALVGYPRRFRNQYRAAAAWVRAGALGELVQVTCEWSDEHVQDYATRSSPTFRSRPEESVRGTLLDHGSHMLDAALWVCNARIASVMALTRGVHAGVDTQAALVARLVGGALLTAAVFAVPAGARRRVVRVRGTRGWLEVDDDGARLASERETAELRHAPDDDGVVAGFARALRGAPSGGCTLAQGAHVVAALDAAYLSAASGAAAAVEAT